MSESHPICGNSIVKAAHFNCTHGGCYTRAYRSWRGMKGRCLNKNHDRYSYYGGRGITVCDRWLSFENFLADMGEPPLGKTLDRIDNEGAYEKTNCRWASRKEQNRNTRVSVMITYAGQTKAVREWAEEMGVKGDTLLARIKYGWSHKRTIETPIRPY